MGGKPRSTVGPASSPALIEDAGAWRAAAATDRAAAVAALARSLAGGWQADGERLRYGDGVFAVVPGGWLRMGFAPDEVLAACRARKRSPVKDSSWPESIARARPSRLVRVDPFAVSIESLVATGVLEPICEAELEWLLRDAGRGSFIGTVEPLSTANRTKLLPRLVAPFGLEELFDVAQSCADDWHPNLAGGPSSSVPWGDGASVAREVHTMWQDADEELIGLHAAARVRMTGPGRAVLRLRDALGLIAAGQPPSQTGCEQMCARIGNPGKERKLLGWALDILGGAAGDDLVPAVHATIENLGAGKPAEIAAQLRWLGDLAFGTAAEAVGSDPWPRSAIRAAIGEHVIRLQSLLESDHSGVRAAAAIPLAACGAAPVAEAVAARYAAESDPAVLGSLLLGAAFLARAGAGALPSGNPKDAAVAPVRAIAEAILGRIDPDGLIAAAVAPVVARLPWFRGDLIGGCAALLAKVPGTDRGELALRLLAPPAGSAWLSVFRAAGALAFPPLARNHWYAPHELSAAQLEVARQFRSRGGYAAVRDAARSLPWESSGMDLLFGAAEAIAAAEEKRHVGTVMVLRAAGEEVELDGRRMPLLFALREIWAQTINQRRSDQIQRVERVLAPVTIDRLLSLHAGLHDRALMPKDWFYQRQLWFSDPGEVCAWPYAGNRIYPRIAAAPAAERRQVRARIEADIPAALASDPRTTDHLLLFVACLDPDERVPADIRDQVGPAHLARFGETGGVFLHGLRAFGDGWVEERIIAWIRPLAEAILSGASVPRTPELEHLPHLIEADWSPRLMNAVAVLDLLDTGCVSVWPICNGLRPALRHHRGVLPQSFRALYAGEDQKREARDPATRRAAVADLWAAASR
ncbi:MAG TPA: hypothetical protein VML75_05090 [Kofleriaceae bacterium]|nr:hypothetical protein [Kofleriaceae bacterium]